MREGSERESVRIRLRMSKVAMTLSVSTALSIMSMRFCCCSVRGFFHFPWR